jgi:thiol-disulfide isomerase/thioredoxin
MKRLALIVLLLIAAACSARSAGEPDADAFYAPDFTLTALDGPTVTLSGLRGRWVIINFWATWCPPCVAEMPALQRIAVSEADRLTVLGINMREDEPAVRDFIDANAITYPILLRPGDRVVIDYQVIGLPQTLVVDPAGEVVLRTFGPIDTGTFADDLRARLDAE